MNVAPRTPSDSETADTVDAGYKGRHWAHVTWRSVVVGVCLLVLIAITIRAYDALSYWRESRKTPNYSAAAPISAETLLALSDTQSSSTVLGGIRLRTSEEIVPLKQNSEHSLSLRAVIVDKDITISVPIEATSYSPLEMVRVNRLDSDPKKKQLLSEAKALSYETKCALLKDVLYYKTVSISSFLLMRHSARQRHLLLLSWQNILASSPGSGRPTGRWFDGPEKTSGIIWTFGPYPQTYYLIHVWAKGKAVTVSISATKGDVPDPTDVLQIIANIEIRPPNPEVYAHFERDP